LLPPRLLNKLEAGCCWDGAALPNKLGAPDAGAAWDEVTLPNKFGALGVEAG